MMTLPGLGLAGSKGETLSKIGDEAIQSANSLMDQYSTVNWFLGTHAKAINELVESGADINNGCVDQLLGLAPMVGSFTPPRGGSISRYVSYSTQLVSSTTMQRCSCSIASWFLVRNLMHFPLCWIHLLVCALYLPYTVVCHVVSSILVASTRGWKAMASTALKNSSWSAMAYRLS